MKSPIAALALTLLCLSPAIALADDGDGHPLIGEPPAPVHLATPDDGDATSPKLEVTGTVRTGVTGVSGTFTPAQEIGDAYDFLGVDEIPPAPRH